MFRGTLKGCSLGGGNLPSVRWGKGEPPEGAGSCVEWRLTWPNLSLFSCFVAGHNYANGRGSGIQSTDHHQASELPSSGGLPLIWSS